MNHPTHSTHPLTQSLTLMPIHRSQGREIITKCVPIMPTDDGDRRIHDGECGRHAVPMYRHGLASLCASLPSLCHILHPISRSMFRQQAHERTIERIRQQTHTLQSSVSFHSVPSLSLSFHTARQVRMQMLCFLIGSIGLMSVRRQKYRSASLFDQRRSQRLGSNDVGDFETEIIEFTKMDERSSNNSSVDSGMMGNANNEETVPLTAVSLDVV